MKSTLHVLNAFSINMLAGTTTLRFAQLSLDEAQHMCALYNVQSHVGHADMAAVISTEIGTDIPMVRDTYEFERGDKVLVCQYRGPRLEEGTTKLPAGSTIEWWAISNV